MNIRLFQIGNGVLLATVITALNLFAEGETMMPMLSWAWKSNVVDNHNDVPIKCLNASGPFAGLSTQIEKELGATIKSRDAIRESNTLLRVFLIV